MRCPARRLAVFSWFFAEAVLLTKKSLPAFAGVYLGNPGCLQCRIAATSL
jgi:hypothetical protein